MAYRTSKSWYNGPPTRKTPLTDSQRGPPAPMPLS